VPCSSTGAETDPATSPSTGCPPPDPDPGPCPSAPAGSETSAAPTTGVACPEPNPVVCPEGTVPTEDGKCEREFLPDCGSEEGAHSHPPADQDDSPGTSSPDSCRPTGGTGSGEQNGAGGGSGDQNGNEPQFVCWDGSTRSSADECPIERAQCPGGSISVPVGEPCPTPEPTPAPPVTCWDGSTAATTFDCPAGRTFCPGGVTVPAGEKCPPTESETRCAQGTVRVLGVCTPVLPDNAPAPKNGAPPPREADPGELLFDRHVITAGEELYARGAGCSPGAETTLTADGELVGRTVADQDGRFETGVRFGSFRPGYREVTVSCGTELAAGIEMVLVAADTSASATSVLLPFFLALGFLAVNYQAAARGRRRARARLRRPS